MKLKAIFPLIILIGLMVPLAQSATINGPTIFQGPHGGYVFYNAVTTSTNINVQNGIWRLAHLVIGGSNRGVLGFDCDTGVNMTILSVSRYTVRYRVNTALPGAVSTYVFYGNNRNLPVGTNTDTVTYNDATDITTVTTTGNGVIVTLDYATLSATGVNGLNLMFEIFPIIVMVLSLEAKKRDIINSKALVYLLVAASAAFVILAIRAFGA